MIQTTRLPKTARQRRRLYQGSILNFRLLSKETDNSMAIIDTWMLAGTEPPRHMHGNEDVVYMINDGEMIFYIGDNVITARKGDVVFAPRLVAHHFEILGHSCKATLMISPGNFDEYYWHSSYPFDGNYLPGSNSKPSTDELRAMQNLAESFGIRFV